MVTVAPGLGNEDGFDAISQDMSANCSFPPKRARRTFKRSALEIDRALNY